MIQELGLDTVGGFLFELKFEKKKKTEEDKDDKDGDENKDDKKENEGDNNKKNDECSD